MKIMFMGTPEFANYSLKAMKDEGYDVCAVVTQPDKPKGRGHNIAHPAVYDMAESYNIPIYQPVNLKKETFEDILVSANPDIIVVTAYGKILPEYVLNYPKYGCINVHGSLLPKYRGAAPMQWAIINGETKTGITIMYMEKGLDTGDMILKEELDITQDDTYETLHDKMAELSKSALIGALKLIEDGTATREKQDDALSCYSPMIDKTTARINWQKNARDISNLVRGLNPFPKAYTQVGDKMLKILKAYPTDCKSNKSPGEIVYIDKRSFTVCCGDNTCLEVFEIQAEGKRAMSVEDYFKGNSLETGTVLL